MVIIQCGCIVQLIENLFLTPDEDIVEVGVITCQFYKVWPRVNPITC